MIMNKKFAFFFLLILLSQHSIAQLTNQISIDEKTSKRMLISLCERNAFEDTSFSSWFQKEYNSYNVDTSTINLTTNELKGINVQIILGTWCSDSREQVPRLFKILDYAGFPESRILMIAVDRSKKAGDYDVASLKIELVPTIILYKDDAEVGRIIETPRMSLEEDMVEILFTSRKN